jgi:hypothetical protein
MIFDELVSEVCEKLNLTSDEARARVGREINNRYRRITSSIGLDTSRRTQVSASVVIGNQNITFTGIEKIFAVIDKTTGTNTILEEITVDEMEARALTSGPPRSYAIYRNHKNSVEAMLDYIPVGGYTLYADGMANLSTLAGSLAPDFPESFHDILIFGAMADEYRKMEKLDLAKDADMSYELRLSDLRMWLAKSAYLDIYAGKRMSRPWMDARTRTDWWG